MRFLLVDRILELEGGKRATGIKNVTLSEDFFTHHFPGEPIMPGALITECLVQLADWVIRENSNFEQVSLPESFDRVKFHRMVCPGDQLHLEVEITPLEDQRVAVRGKASANGKVVASARFKVARHSSEPFQKPGRAKAIFRMLRAKHPNER